MLLYVWYYVLLYVWYYVLLYVWYYVQIANICKLWHMNRDLPANVGKRVDEAKFGSLFKSDIYTSTIFIQLVHICQTIRRLSLRLFLDLWHFLQSIG